jgi:GTPase
MTEQKQHRQDDDHDSSLTKTLDEKQLQKAILIGTYNGSRARPLCEDHLKELACLADTYGIETAGSIPCPIKKIDRSTYLGKGKVAEIKEILEKKQADIIIFDNEILPSQQRNLEKHFGCPVMDRTELILGIFAKRAHSKDAKLQIELAQARYQLPRLKKMWSHFSRQSTGKSGAYLKGEGEKQIEIDKRIFKRKITLLQKELQEIVQHRKVQRKARVSSGIPTIAIIGYTNAGKSTLLKALTDADVFIEDKLFATLDTTTRKFTLPNNQDILLVDTVGFIRKIPHALVAAFRSTLEEAVETDILLHIIDVNHPLAEEHAEATYDVLHELHGENKPIISVLNKVDACTDNGNMANKLRTKYSKTVQISALNKTGFDDLIQIIIQELGHLRAPLCLRIPQSEYALVSELNEAANILHQDYEDNDVIIHANVPKTMMFRVEKFIETKE